MTIPLYLIMRNERTYQEYLQLLNETDASAIYMI